MQQPQPRVLIVHSDPEIGQSIAKLLAEEGFGTAAAKDGPAALLLMATGDFAMLIIENNFSGKIDAADIVHKGRIRRATLKALYLSSHADRPNGIPELDSFLSVPCKLRDIVGCTWELYCRGLHGDEAAVPRLDVEIGAGASQRRSPLPTQDRAIVVPLAPRDPITAAVDTPRLPVTTTLPVKRTAGLLEQRRRRGCRR